MEFINHKCLHCDKTFSLPKEAVAKGEQHLYFLTFDPEYQKEYSSVIIANVNAYSNHLYSHQNHCGIEHLSTPSKHKSK